MALAKIGLGRLLTGPWLFSDETLYAREALAILRHGWAALRGEAQEYTLLYPLLLAPAFALESRAEAHQAALAVNALVSTSALFPIYWIARRMLPVALSAGLVAVIAILPPVFVYALALSSENLFFPLFWWGSFFLLRLAQDDRARDAVVAGLAIGLLPSVKLTGFAVLAAATVLVIGMALFHRIDGRRAAACLVALFLPQLVWVGVRDLLAGPERGLFGFGPGVGESLLEGLGRLQREGWRSLVAFFVSETTYFLVGAYVAWIAFSIYLVTQYRTWRSRSIEGFLLLWTFLAAMFLSVVTVLLLFPIAQSLADPLQRARPIYGRFIEVLFPAFFILGTRGMLDFAWKEMPGVPAPPAAPRRELALVLITLVFTAISFYPLTQYAVSSRLAVYAFRADTAAGVVLALILLPSVAAGTWLLGRRRGGRWPIAIATGAMLAMQGLVFGVSVAGVVRGARANDVSLFRIGHWLALHERPGTRLAYDTELGFGDQYFAYRFWSDADLRPTAPGDLLRVGADFVITKRPFPLPILAREGNGVTLYATSARSPGITPDRKPKAGRPAAAVPIGPTAIGGRAPPHAASGTCASG